MKFIAFLIGLLLIAGCAHAPATSSPVNIDGLWEGVVDSGMGGPPIRMTFNFLSEGESIGGFLRNESIQDGWDPLEDFKIKGNKISFTYTPKNSQAKIIYKFKGKINGDEIKLSSKIGGPGMGKPSRTERSMSNNEGSQIRSGATMSKGIVGGPGMDTGSPPSQRFTITRVKE